MVDKQEVKFPKLSKKSGVLSENNSSTPEAIKKIIEFVPDFDEDSDDSEQSEILDLFEQFHKDSYLIKRPGQRRLKKEEAVKLTMQAFSDDYKKVMSELRKEQQLGENMVYEDPNDDFSSIKKLKTNFEPFKEMEKLAVTESGTFQGDDQQRKSLESNDFMSGMWSLLEKHGEEGRKFIITPPWYNAYKGEEPHWTERPHIPWSVVDESRQKCEKWFEKNEEKRRQNMQHKSKSANGNILN